MRFKIQVFKAAKDQEFRSLNVHLLWGRVGHETAVPQASDAALGRQIEPTIPNAAWHTHTLPRRR